MVMVPDHPCNRETPGPRKRRLSPAPEPQPDDAPRPPCKKPKLGHAAFPPPQFWENLSTVHLTANALRALEASPDQDPPAASPRSGAAGLDRLPHFRRSPSFLGHVRHFARHGGPDLRDVRGRPHPCSDDMAPSQSSLGKRKSGSNGSKLRLLSGSTPRTTPTPTTGPYDSNFHQNLVDHGVYPLRYRRPDGSALAPPDNLDEIRQALRQRRPSLSSSQVSEEAFDSFQEAEVLASKESRVMRTIIPIIEGKVDEPRCASGDVSFGNLAHLTDGSLVPGNPDIYYGARPEQLDRRVRRDLSRHIVPSAKEEHPMAPNFFLEVKGLNGSLSVASRQARYCGALRARGIHSLQTYGLSSPHFDNKAYTITSTYHGGTLALFATHPLPPSRPGGQAEYAMTRINGWSLSGNYESFREGISAYRNARDWAKRQRDEMMKKANERIAATAAR